jgi:hypothetical protein
MERGQVVDLKSILQSQDPSKVVFDDSGRLLAVPVRMFPLTRTISSASPCPAPKTKKKQTIPATEKNLFPIFFHPLLCGLISVEFLSILTIIRQFF